MGTQFVPYLSGNAFGLACLFKCLLQFHCSLPVPVLCLSFQCCLLLTLNQICMSGKSLLTSSSSFSSFSYHSLSIIPPSPPPLPFHCPLLYSSLLTLSSFLFPSPLPSLPSHPFFLSSLHSLLSFLSSPPLSPLPGK